MKKIFLSHPHAISKTAISFSDWLKKSFFNEIDVICTSETEHQISSGHMITTGIIDYIKSSTVVIVLVTPESLKLPWIFYEMGAAHALGKVFIPCVSSGLSLGDLPPQAYEYQGVNLNSSHDLSKLLTALSRSMDISLREDERVPWENK